MKSVVVLWCLCVDLVVTFNVETDYFVLHRGPPDSKFGFSVAHHRDRERSWVLVGAPEASTFQPDVERGGAVYKCAPDRPDDCEPIPFDLTGNHWETGQQMDNKSMQWFGASVASRSGVIVACAPRYVWFSVKKNRREPVGNCFISTGQETQPFQMYSPCMTPAWGYHRQGSCQAGFGAALSKNGNRLYVGAVGSFYWQGQVFYQDLLNKQEALATPEGPQQDDMSYLGYSVATGEFNGDLEEDLAVGMPRGANLSGQVVVLDHRLEVLLNISGPQIGSYFGYSVAVLDMNGDGLDDVAVGAPWYTDPAASSAFEVGLVTTYAQTKQHNFATSSSHLGYRSRSHFGLSLASLGDLDRDGYEDLAVGAPYDGEERMGGVYIFLGGPKGLSKTPSQTLLAEELTGVRVGTFGWSLAGGGDLDGNEYPDLAVGAYDNNKVAVFRTRPVVQVQAEISFSSRSGLIDLKERQCSLQRGLPVSCVALQYCLTYDGHGVPAQLDMGVSVRLDMEKQTGLPPRMFFLDKERHASTNATISLRKSVQGCKSVYTYVTGDPHDKLTPLVAELQYALPDGDHTRVRRETLRPIMAPRNRSAVGAGEGGSEGGSEGAGEDQQQHYPLRTTIYIRNNCGADNVCIPDLQTRVKISPEEYGVGSLDNLEVEVGVNNDGEDAFQARLLLQVPPGVTFSKFLVARTSFDDLTPICSSSIKEEAEEVICDLGNPLPADEDVVLRLLFQPNVTAILATASDPTSVPSLTFNISATSANPEAEGAEMDNYISQTINVTYKSDVDIKGISWPDGAFDYKATRFGSGLLGKDTPVQNAWDVGPEVTHIYDITNQGPSDLPEASIYLLWPTRTLAGDPMLYLLEEPEVSGAAVCQPVSDINYLGLTIGESSHQPLTAAALKSKIAQIHGEDDDEDTHGHSRRRRSRHNHHGLRTKRQDEQNEGVLGDELSCGPTMCTRVKCTVSPLAAKSNIIVRVRSRLWVDTIEKLGRSEVQITSRLVVAGAGQLWSGTISSVVRTGVEEHGSSLKWMVIMASVLAGLLLLAILVAALWAMGFFKRKRPQDKAEAEPLNGNTEHNGAS